MANQKRGKKEGSSNLPEQRRETYKGHEIIYRPDERHRRLFIDGRPIRYGQAGDEYYLEVYAFDRAKTLEAVVRRYLDYVETVAMDRGKEE